MGRGGGGSEDEEDDGVKMGFSGLFFMAFFWVCGGPYGGEGLIQLAPSAIVFSSLLVITLVYSLPIALINAELSVAIPEDGGLVVWTQVAFGTVVGGHNAWWCFVSYLCDAAIYPILAGNYIAGAVGLHDDDRDHLVLWHGGHGGQSSTAVDYQQVVLMSAELCVLLVTILKLMGPDMVVKFAELCSYISLIPAFVFLIWGFAAVPIKPDRWVLWEFQNVTNSSIPGDLGHQPVRVCPSLLGAVLMVGIARQATTSSTFSPNGLTRL
jgi:amino acid transporter